MLSPAWLLLDVSPSLRVLSLRFEDVPPGPSPGARPRCLLAEFRGSFIVSPVSPGPSPPPPPCAVSESCRTFAAELLMKGWRGGCPPVSTRPRSLRRRQAGFYRRRGGGGGGGAAARRRVCEALNSDPADCTFSDSDYSPAETRFYIPAPISRGDGRRLMDGVDPGS